MSIMWLNKQVRRYHVMRIVWSSHVSFMSSMMDWHRVNIVVRISKVRGYMVSVVWNNDMCVMNYSVMGNSVGYLMMDWVDIVMNGVDIVMNGVDIMVNWVYIMMNGV